MMDALTQDKVRAAGARAGGLRIGRESAPAPTSPPPAAGNALADDSSWMARWCRTRSLEERLSMINQLSGKRLPSHLAAEVWLHLQARVIDALSTDELELMWRQFVILAPEHKKACAAYDALMARPDGKAQGDAGLVFMITSCERYMAQAQRVLADLRAHGCEARIMVGDPSRSVAVDDGSIVRLPVPDSYEALLSKVLEGLTFLRRSHGPVSIAKVDDDMRLNRRFDPSHLAQVARTMEYVGHPLGDYAPDRCWHLGKTSVPTPIFTRRHRGRFAYGPLYLLGARAVEHLVREWVFYPGEFAGEIYEDRAVGDALRRAGIELRPMSFTDMGGIVDETERPIQPTASLN